MDSSAAGTISSGADSPTYCASVSVVLPDGGRSADAHYAEIRNKVAEIPEATSDNERGFLDE